MKPEPTMAEVWDKLTPSDKQIILIYYKDVSEVDDMTLGRLSLTKIKSVLLEAFAVIKGKQDLDLHCACPACKENRTAVQRIVDILLSATQ